MQNHSAQHLQATVVVFILLMVAFISGCSSAQITEAPTGGSETEVGVTSTQVVTAPANILPEHTSSNTPSDEIVSTPTPEPEDTQQDSILIQLAIMPGGDGLGGSRYDFIYFDYTPELILYKDGLLVISGIHYGAPYWYVYKYLSPDEMCNLLNQLRSTGFFEAEGNGLWPDDPIYATPPGAIVQGYSSYNLVINGIPDKAVNIKIPAVDFLVESVKEAFILINEYHPEDMVSFQPYRFILRVDPLPIEEWEFPTPEVIMQWPSGLPELAPISDRSVDNRFFVIEGEQGELLSQEFEFPRGYLVEDGGREFMIVGRPILPHQTIANFTEVDYYSKSFEIPFNCDEE